MPSLVGSEMCIRDRYIYIIPFQRPRKSVYIHWNSFVWERELTFITESRDNPESRTKSQDKSRGMPWKNRYFCFRKPCFSTIYRLNPRKKKNRKLTPFFGDISWKFSHVLWGCAGPMRPCQPVNEHHRCSWWFFFNRQICGGLFSWYLGLKASKIPGENNKIKFR